MNNDFFKRITELASPVETVWGKVTAIDEDKCSITALLEIGTTRDDIKLGTNGIVEIPKIGSSCLIGLVNIPEDAAFLIYSDQTREAYIKL